MFIDKYFKQILSSATGILSMMLILVIAFGCSEELKVEEILEVDNTSPVVSNTDGTLTLGITSNATWKVGNIDATWLKVDTDTGEGNGQIVISYDINENVESRTAEFFIVTTQDGKYHKIEFTQLATEPFIELTQHELEVGSRPRSHEIELKSNVHPQGINVEIQYDQGVEENWVVGVNVVEGSISFQTILNSLEEQRTATLILSYIDISGEEIEVWDMLTINQMASGNEPPAEIADFSYVRGLPLGEIVENIFIEGNIVSTGLSDNFRKGTYIIQDENGSAIAFEAIETLSFDKYDKINLLLDGALLQTFEESGSQYRVIRGLSSSNILSSEADASFTPNVMSIGELTDDHLLSLVTLKDVEFAIPHGGYSNFHEYYLTQSYADYATKHYPTPIIDIEGYVMYMITNKEVSYRRNSVPKGSGNISGIVVKISDSAYGDLGSYSIRHLAESDIDIASQREDGFTETLVEWELGPTTGFPNGTPNLPPTTGPSSATLQKDEGTGFYSGNTLNGIYLIDKYRGDKPGANTIISNSSYNVNSWGAGRYWVMDNVSTLGINSTLYLQFEAVSISSTGTGGGPRDFAVEYSLDGEDWKRVTEYQINGQIAANQVQNVTAGLKMFSYKLPEELYDRPNIKIRLLNLNNTSVNGGSIAIPGSTSRLGHFSIKYKK